MSHRSDRQGAPPRISPERLPKFEAWRTSFEPPLDAISYVTAHLSVTDLVVLLNLIAPPLIEVEGCILLEDRYSPERFAEWSAQLDGSTPAIESVINQVDLWDVFDPDDAEEAVLEPVAEHIAVIWLDHARRQFPGREFRTAVTASYGPGMTLWQEIRRGG